jgi:hypothetical protein
MRIIEKAIGVLEDVTPLGFVIAGGALALTLMPSAGKVLRRAAVLTTRGVLSLTNTATVVTEGTANKIREEYRGIVDESRKEQEAMIEKVNLTTMNDHNRSETIQPTNIEGKAPKSKQTKQK